MWNSYSIFTVSVNKPSGLLQFVFTKEATLRFHFFTNIFYLSLFLKKKLHIKVIKVIPLFVFSFVYARVSPLLFIYFISFILSFILFHFIIINLNFNFYINVLFLFIYFIFLLKKKKIIY